jgi:hypothetical protein
MKAESKCSLEFETLNVIPCGFLQGARCTNVNTFGILPHRLMALRKRSLGTRLLGFFEIYQV